MINTKNNAKTMPIQPNPLIALGAGAALYKLSESKTAQKLVGKVAKVATAVVAGKKILNAIDEVSARLAGAGLTQSGTAKSPDGLTETSATGANSDWRFRVSVGASAYIFYKSGDPGIMMPLQKTNGVIFPYTPQVTVSYVNNYAAIS